jgi:dipeptidyl aminopeptidase/acylaminoacyl peptidase
MRNSPTLALLYFVVSVVLCVPISAHATTTPPPSEAFGTIPLVRGVVMSPDGNTLAWIQSDAAQERVVMYDLATQKAKRWLDAGRKAKLRDLVWVDDETLLIEASVTAQVGHDAKREYEFFRLLAADVSGSGIRALLSTDANFNYVTGAELLAVRPSKSKAVYLSTWDFSANSQREEIGTRLAGGRKDSGWVLTLFEVDTASGKGRIVARGTPFTVDWAVDGNGRVLARSEWNPSEHLYRLLAADGNGWREIVKQSDGEQLQLVGPISDSTAILALGSRGQGRVRAWSIPLDGSPPTILAEDAERDVTSLRYDGIDRKALAAWLSGTRPELQWLDKPTEARYLSVARAFRGSQLVSYQESGTHGRALALVDGTSRPPMYYVIDFATGKAVIVGDEYPALSGAALGEVSEITYAARDGTSIPALLTLPPGSLTKNLPMVVLPHGGPNSHDRYGFDWLAQFLATRGYAVLQPQFRGSTGYGEAFRKAGDHQWGGLMQDDITDGVKALLDRGVADPRRICIVGASYGGYAALAGAAFTPDLYACAASIGGVSDLPAMLVYEDRQHGNESNAVAYWKENIGSAHDANTIAKSPARAAASVRAPILLIHGVDDTVVPIVQSQMMEQALKTAGRKAMLVRLPGEDHWLSRAETRIRVLKELESFLAANLRAQ